MIVQPTVLKFATIIKCAVRKPNKMVSAQCNVGGQRGRLCAEHPLRIAGNYLYLICTLLIYYLRRTAARQVLSAFALPVCPVFATSIAGATARLSRELSAPYAASVLRVGHVPPILLPSVLILFPSDLDFLPAALKTLQRPPPQATRVRLARSPPRPRCIVRQYQSTNCMTPPS
jgi:hypothetical protein